MAASLHRRNFLRIGTLGVAGFGLADYLRLASAGDVKSPHATSAIFINLAGGPSHIDTFDPKPDAPVEYRGEFKAIGTKVPGLQLCEHLPGLARCANKYALVRGVSHTLTEHQMGTMYMNTGNRPIPSMEFPGYGSVVSKELSSPRDLPPFVAIPKTPQVPGILGVEFAPFSTQGHPKAGQPFTVRGMTTPSSGSAAEKGERRQKLLTELDASLTPFEKDNNLLKGLDRFSQQAYDILRSPRASRAFDTSQEPASTAKLFGESPLAQSSLLAMRLVEAGVRFVSIEHGGWDTHDHIFTTLKDKLLPELDQSLSALMTALDLKGLLKTTSIFVTGEFGRTPKVSRDRVGRDHYPRAMFVLLAGGGMTGGQVIGGSDAKAEAPAKGDGYSPDDVAASFYHSLGIDASKEYRTPTGRPIAIVRHGKIIRDLFA